MKRRDPAFAAVLGLILAGLACISFVGQPSAARTPAQSQAKTSQPTVGTTFKNIQVLTDLKDQPPTQLYNTMQFIAGSLSVSCNYCHASEHGPFDSDAKKTKQIAREMIKMTRAINANSFHGEQVVTCNTCHQGSTRPNAVPSPWYKTAEQITQYNQAVPADAAASAPAAAQAAPAAENSAPSLPSVDQIMGKYRQAVGADGLKSLSLKGTNLVAVSGNFTPVPFEADFLFPGQIAFSQGATGAESKLVINGDKGWRGSSQGFTPLPAAQVPLLRSRLNELSPVKDETPGAEEKVARVESIGGKRYYVVEATLPVGVHKLFFDTQSGLLYKSRMEEMTALGKKVEEQTFEDYRKVNGVMLAFLITNHYMEEESVYRISSAQVNLPLNPASFSATAEHKESR